MSGFKTLLAAGASACVFAASGAALADEGMWPVDAFPSAAVKAKYGVNVDKAFLDRIRGASARIPGCSAGVVSKDGLMQTNYHCVESCAGNLSTPENDYFVKGFLTSARTEEKQCPGMWAEILQSIDDVTARVNAAGAGKTGAPLVQALSVETAAIEKESCANQTGFRCQVISFYGGGQYKLYKFRRYDDVRLVFAPEFKTGFFGGDPDNFNFPRFNLDISYIRLYDGGKPASTPVHFKWNPAAPMAGEPIFVPGNPGTTQRQLTMAQLNFLRSTSLLAEHTQRSELRGKFLRLEQESPDAARLVSDTLIGLENSFKVYFGRLKVLLDDAFMGKKAKEEADLRARVAANAELAQAVGDPWGEIARAYDAYGELYPSYYFLETNAGGGSTLFGYARALVRAAAEREKPVAERLPGYDDASLQRLAGTMAAATKVEPELERVYLGHWLSKAREYLTADAPETKLLLGRDAPEAKARALVSGTKLADPAARKALLDGGMAAVQASDDPLIKLALAIDPAARGVRRQVEQTVTGPVSAAQSRIARARFGAYGDTLYPDATFSLRITYGQVAGWTERGKEIPPVTTLGGLYQRATGQAPYDLPQSWFKAESKVNKDTVFNFSGTGDIIGGASGSPTLNAKGEVIGAVFDGNIWSLGGAYGYDPVMNRSVHVAASGIQEALLKVYGREALVKELNGK